MQSYLTNWISNFFDYFATENSKMLLNLLYKEDFEQTYKQITQREEIEKLIYQIIRVKRRDDQFTKTWAEFVINHFLFKIYKYRESFQKSFENLKECFSQLTEIFKAYETPNFLSNLLKFYMRNFLFLSHLADGELEKNKQKAYCLDECGRVLISFFSTFQMSNEKNIVFFCIICLIRVYFKLKNYRNSKTLIGWVEKSGLNLNSLPKSELSTFYYYSGRLNLYDMKLIDAYEILTNALNICKANQFANRKLILEYLIPLNLFYGIVPTEELMTRYELNNYSQLVNAYESGNLLDFETAIETLEERLINLGSFLIIEKLKAYVMRNLIKMIYNAYSDEFAKMNTPVMKIEIIYNVLRNVMKCDSFDMDELELYIIGLMYKGLISGYVHNANKVIVFSKKNPFPKLQDLFTNNYNKII
jgi:hypothetical protein